MIDTCIFSESREDKNWIEGLGGFYFFCCFLSGHEYTPTLPYMSLFSFSVLGKWRLPAYERWEDSEWL